MSVDIIVQLAGAIAILIGFALVQFKVTGSTAYIYLVLNLVGSLLLLATAIANSQWGFVLMESCWALISTWSIVERMRGASEG